MSLLLSETVKLEETSTRPG